MSLFDIAPDTVEATVGGKTIKVPGVPLITLTSLLTRFPALQAILGDKNVKAEELDPAKILTTLPEAAVAVIVAGLGPEYNTDPETRKKAEAHVAGFPVGTQIILFDAVVRASVASDPDFLKARIDSIAAVFGGKDVAKSRAKT